MLQTVNLAKNGVDRAVNYATLCAMKLEIELAEEEAAFVTAEAARLGDTAENVAAAMVDAGIEAYRAKAGNEAPDVAKG